MISITEVDLGKTLKQLEKSPQTFLALGCQPENSTALLAFDTGFASSVIDLILTGKGEEINVPRKLSPIENTIHRISRRKYFSGNQRLGRAKYFVSAIGRKRTGFDF